MNSTILILHRDDRRVPSREPRSLDKWDTGTFCAIALTLLGGCSTSNNLDQFACDDGLTSSVEENLELVDHISSVL